MTSGARVSNRLPRELLDRTRLRRAAASRARSRGHIGRRPRWHHPRDEVTLPSSMFPGRAEAESLQISIKASPETLPVAAPVVLASGAHGKTPPRIPGAYIAASPPSWLRGRVRARPLPRHSAPSRPSPFDARRRHPTRGLSRILLAFRPAPDPRVPLVPDSLFLRGLRASSRKPRGLPLPSALAAGCVHELNLCTCTSAYASGAFVLRDSCIRGRPQPYTPPMI